MKNKNRQVKLALTSTQYLSCLESRDNTNSSCLTSVYALSNTLHILVVLRARPKLQTSYVVKDIFPQRITFLHMPQISIYDRYSTQMSLYAKIMASHPACQLTPYKKLPSLSLRPKYVQNNDILSFLRYFSQVFFALIQVK